MTVLKEKMKELKVTQKELSISTGISISFIKQIVNGKQEAGVDKALRVCKHLDLLVEEAFNDQGRAI